MSAAPRAAPSTRVRRFAYPPYDDLDFEVPVRDDGDVNARVWIRIREVEQSLELIEQIIERLPTGKTRKPLDGRSGACARVSRWSKVSAATCLPGCASTRKAASRAAICAIRPGSSGRCSEAAIEGNIVADFPLCNKSFNCSYSGHDL